MANNNTNRACGAHTGGSNSGKTADHIFATATLALIGLAALAVSEGDAAATPSNLDLMHLQVFAKQSIQSQRSDYEGPVAAGGDIDLSDFQILGDLTSGGRVSFRRGQVQGFVNADSPQLSQVFSSGVGPVPGLATDLAAIKLDLLAARLSSMPTTSRFEANLAGDGKHELRAAAFRTPEVVDLQAEQLMAGNDETRVALTGDHEGAVLVRIHGRSVRLQHVGFTSTGGLTPSRIVYYFPEATNLEISSSGGAVDADGKQWNIPGSIIAPNAALKFVASTVTGQVFARSILSTPGAVGGQVDRFPAPTAISNGSAGSNSNFTPSELLQMVAADDFADRFQALSTAPARMFSTLPSGCRMVCSYHAELSFPDDKP